MALRFTILDLGSNDVERVEPLPTKMLPAYGPKPTVTLLSPVTEIPPWSEVEGGAPVTLTSTLLKIR